ncbi:ABC transporter ATP-binding protein [Actinomadura madurae]|uniref:ABC transporter ATP-binding protein n=1 Tax=Actinomadura madurae TaxID=1993 RepID=UPI00399B237E
MSLLALEGLRVSVGDDFIVDDVDLSLEEGEIVCLVGESGSGKTTAALAAFGWCAPGLRIEGRVSIADSDVTARSRARSVRGDLISYVPQSPGTALNPAHRVLDTLNDMVRSAPRAPGGEDVLLGSLAAVGLTPERQFGRRFPHQLSGGQQQRVCIAAALASQSKVIVLDEPTTGLDVVTQAKILEGLVQLRDEESVAMLYITHDLAVAAKIADRIVVMYGGYVVEQGSAFEVLRRPRHPYTRALMAATPDHRISRELEALPGGPVDLRNRTAGCAFAPRCGQKVESCELHLPALSQIGDAHLVRCTESLRTPALDLTLATPAASRVKADAAPVLEVTHLEARHATRSESIVAARGISFSVQPGQCVALVGESGSGKTTIARSVVGLHRHWSGAIRLDGEEVAHATKDRTRKQLQRVQMVFQNPADTLNPRHSVGAAISRSAMVLRGLSRTEAGAEVERLLEAVRLPARYAERYPGELSGGQRQRVSIARALAADPGLIVCDEITSALDVSVQAVVLDVLDDLRRSVDLSLLFITHDLAVVSTIADQVLVLEQGLICESGPVRGVLDQPKSDYTRRLLAAAPSLSEQTADHAFKP